MKYFSKYRFFIIMLLILIMLGFISSKKYGVSIEEITLSKTTKRNQFTAGDTIELTFEMKAFNKNKKISPETIKVYLQSNWTQSVITPIIEGQALLFKIPDFISEKSGVVKWQLFFEDKEILNDYIKISPNSKNKSLLETYLGPESIIAGGKEYTMAISIPTDIYDNLLLDSTQVKTQIVFQETNSNNISFTKNGITWVPIYSTEKTGKLFIGTNTQQSISKEMVVSVTPANPVSFRISEARAHPFADGNEVTYFTTSVIKDSFGNIVADGTLVNFEILSPKGHVLKTSGTTINGIALGKMLHPTRETSYTIKAFVDRIAESPSITVFYKSAIKEIPVKYVKEKKTVFIGPIKTFLNQIVPEGTQVKISLIPDQTTILETERGMVSLELPEGILPIEGVSIFIDVLGNHKKVILENLE